MTLSRPAAGRVQQRWAGAMVLTALAFVAAAGYLGSHFIPSTEAVRIRNSFLVASELPGDFDWRPPAVPAGFKQQAGDAPPAFREAASLARIRESALERASTMINDLNPGRRFGGAIQRSTVEAYRIIATTGTGYCADYTQVVNGLAWAAGIPVREWGISFDGFGGWGRAFNEVFDAALGKWVMIDPFNAFWVRDVETGVPLSAVEFRDRLRLAKPLITIELVRLDATSRVFKSDSTMIAYYQRGVDQFYLWWGNNVFDYDEHWLVWSAGRVSRSLEQLAAIVAGVHPRIRILPTAGNAEMVRELDRTRTRILALLGLCALATIALPVEAVMWRRASRRSR